ncbi:prepilin peptidase [Candidatus Roizmanbacteria bacterium]|nr:prepilin peptidase [Candidatus Roizmanbacteria bacterium]
MTALIYSYLFCLGTIFGSFFNVLADRLPREETILGRSHCESCKHVLSGKDLVPLFSFLFLKGKCRYCGHSFSFQYPLSEIFTGVVFVVTWWLFPGDLVVKIIWLGIVSALMVIFLADIRYHIIPDSMEVVLVVLSTALIIAQGNPFITILFRVGEGILVLVPLFLLYLGTKGKGMGFGDVKFAFVIGYLMGLAQGLLVLYFAFIFGGIVGMVLIFLKRKKMKAAIAFGPFLILSLITTILWGNQIIEVIKRMYT